MMALRITFASLILSVVPFSSVRGEDWPTFQHDNHRSAKCGEKLPAAGLELAWSCDFARPQTAWPAPAKWDAYRGLRGLRSMRNYDPVNYVIAAGNSIYFGSSTEDCVRCLDAQTGKQRWAYHSDGPVRVAPAWYDGKVYFGSDDGYAYCLKASDGSLVWRYRPEEEDRLVLNNGRFIPFLPCRSGVLVAADTAYFATALLPWKHSYLCALDATTGSPDGTGRFVSRQEQVTMEGALLASSGHLFVPQGRLPPLIFDRTNGKRLGNLQGGGGCFVLLTPDEHVLHGPGNKTGWITDSRTDSRTQVATYRDGNAMVVSGDVAYLLTDYSLLAMKRSTRQELWKVACTYPYGLILAGETLFVGGDDEVAAFDSKNGDRLWMCDVEGRAYGLVVANGAFFVSTDEGHVDCFRPATGNSQLARRLKGAKAPDSPRAVGHKDVALGAEDIKGIDDPDLIGRWVFREQFVRGHKIKDLTGRNDGTAVGRLRMLPVAGRQALVLDGVSTSVLLAADHKQARLPSQEITAEAWVRIDRPESWGGIIGAVQDNGDDERGWVLGYVDSKFSFAVCGKEGNGRLTYLAAKTDFRPEQWYHVVGTYDGQQIKLYVDGQLQNVSPEQKGPIHYPPQAFYEIGAYHDKNEYIRATGMIDEVRVYRRVLSAGEVIRGYDSKEFPPASSVNVAGDASGELTLGPYLEFTGSDSAVVRWQTKQPSPTILEYGLRDHNQRVEDSQPKKEHEATLKGLKPRRVYTYAIRVKSDGKQYITRSYECDTHFNYSLPEVPERPSPFPTDELTDRYRDAAQHILARADLNRGLCLVYGCREGRLAYEIAKRSDLRIVGVDTNAKHIALARRALSRAGMYGTRVTVHQVASLSELPFASHCANLVVSDELIVHDRPRGNAEEVFRVLRPDGGTAILGRADDGDNPTFKSRLITWLDAGSFEYDIDQRSSALWAQIVRPPLEGAGEWSHQYARPDNSAFGLENLRGASSADELDVQWLGRPGPRAQPDRNGRKPSPLAVGGRLFIEGLHRIIALDQYNGIILWSLEIPQLERFNIPRDSSNWCADEDFVYATIDDKCWRIEAASGKLAGLFDVAEGPKSDWRYDWGYVARAREMLIGSAVKADAAYTNFWGGAAAGWYDATDGPATHKVGSDNLFALDVNSGRIEWVYSDGVIINSTITVGDGSIYLIESRHPDIKAADDRRLGTPQMWQEQYLVSLDLYSGSKRWERPVQTAEGRVVFHQAYAGGKLIIVASGQGNYHVYALDAADGSEIWNDSFPWPSDNHGGHMARPAIVGEAVYVRPYGFDLATGRRLDVKIPGGKCGTYAATTSAFIFRGRGNLMILSATSGKASGWNRLRPDCWLSTVPAGGMLLSPEAGGGCSCGSWIETSLGFAPVTSSVSTEQ